MSDESVLFQLLKQSYIRNGEIPVAFIDETSRSVSEHPGEQQFYVMTGVVVQPHNFEIVRSDLKSIAQSNYWHTTENLSTNFGRNKVIEMLSYLSEGDEISVISHVGPQGFDENDIELAREKTFINLSQHLFNVMGLKLAVLERRNPNSLSRRDEATFSRARREEKIPRNSQLVQVSPSIERLLWLPDLVASAIRQKLARGDSRLINLIEDKVIYLDELEIK